MHRDTRGRLTVPDVVFVLFSLAILGALAPVFMSSLESRASALGPGTAYLFQLLVPLSILVLLVLIYVKATAGVR